ncbi:Hypothetical protein OINT_2000707 [Brucella intermedia LMG 3301]|uniref:Uncharacterized protein n=1 Tax=Brucella intermedia LMG 3301 TaxID=641118 RepID=C4WL14_9HYPH|nr:Hypothetical protein OINT_2000707 [Brucella intermedia LMG 3301]
MRIRALAMASTSKVAFRAPDRTVVLSTCRRFDLRYSECWQMKQCTLT